METGKKNPRCDFEFRDYHFFLKILSIVWDRCMLQTNRKQLSREIKTFFLGNQRKYFLVCFISLGPDALCHCKCSAKFRNELYPANSSTGNSARSLHITLAYEKTNSICPIFSIFNLIFMNYFIFCIVLLKMPMISVFKGFSIKQNNWNSLQDQQWEKGQKILNFLLLIIWKIYSF